MIEEKYSHDMSAHCEVVDATCAIGHIAHNDDGDPGKLFEYIRYWTCKHEQPLGELQCDWGSPWVGEWVKLLLLIMMTKKAANLSAHRAAGCAGWSWKFQNCSWRAAVAVVVLIVVDESR